MLTKDQARALVEEAIPEGAIKSWTLFKDLYLFRVEWPMPLEEEWDPFVSVNSLTGEVRDFSIVTDLTSSEFEELKWSDV